MFLGRIFWQNRAFIIKLFNKLSNYRKVAFDISIHYLQHMNWWLVNTNDNCMARVQEVQKELTHQKYRTFHGGKKSIYSSSSISATMKYLYFFKNYITFIIICSNATTGMKSCPPGMTFVILGQKFVHTASFSFQDLNWAID